jgi:hypothetical protein
MDEYLEERMMRGLGFNLNIPRTSTYKALFSFKKFLDSSSHRILRHMHEALNIN